MCGRMLRILARNHGGPGGRVFMVASPRRDMIFNCPSCTAGHSVPVSMIPSGGLDVTCRRCATSFKVDMHESTQAGAITLPPDSDSDSDETAAIDPLPANPE